MNWLGKSIENSKRLRTHYKMGEIDIYIKDSLPEDIDADSVFKYISNRIPSHLMTSVDIIYIGDFDMFKEREINALFQDGAIYVSNNQDDFDDMVDDIVHEISHSNEKRYFNLLYDDQSLKKEFLAKRNTLYRSLLSHGYKPYTKVGNTYLYDEQIDMSFYKEVGYETILHMTMGLFPSPYAATSLREYFAVGFENYYLKDRALLKKECPVLYKKLSELEFPED